MSRMTLRAASAALAALLLTACQGPGATSPTPRPSAPASALAAADAQMYAGDYEGAEKAYRDSIQAGTPGAAAHLALLLDYESRFREAVDEARADADRQPTSSNLARLTRAYDWANDIPAAVATGERAIKASPLDPLAHVFFGEALADAGRFDESAAQLNEAERAAGDAYLRSEIYREWANYYRDRGDTQSELNNMQLSQRAQPRFPERTLELARYYYVAKRQDAARSALQDATGSTESGGVLAAAGDAAFMAGDFDAATPYYQKAAASAPSETEPVLALAVIAVATKRDFKGAHDQLLAALRRSPADGTVYEFLWNLDRYVLKVDPGAELNAIAPQGGADLQAARGQALDTVNAVRRTAGQGPLSADAALDTASEEHAWYTIFNLGQQSLSGLGVHAEDASLPGYVGASSILRDRAAGYTGNQTSEVINHVATPAAAVGVWEHSVYHRFPLVDTGSRSAGYGEVIVGPMAVAVMDIGQQPDRGGPVLFPANGQKDVPTAFTGNEIPDPAPQGAQYPTGYPVTLQVGSASGLSISSGQLAGPGGKAVDAWSLQPGRQVNANEFCLLPQHPLQPGTTYTVTVAGAIDGAAFNQSWTFTTAPPA